MKKLNYLLSAIRSPKVLYNSTTISLINCRLQSTESKRSSRQKLIEFNETGNSYFLTKPSNLAYFTGNPEFYSTTISLNTFLKQHHLNFGDEEFVLKFREDLKKVKKLPIWMTRADFLNILEIKFKTDEIFSDFIEKLNFLYLSNTKIGKNFRIEKNEAGDELEVVEEIKITEDSTPEEMAVIKNDLKKKLETSKFLEKFLKPGTFLDQTGFKEIKLDEHGKSFTLGSRKSSVAQVEMIKGEGKIYINGMKLDEYFASYKDRENCIKTLIDCKLLGQYNIWCLVKGGGKTGQSDAIKVAIARGLAVHDSILGYSLNEAKLTKIDRRQQERKKSGQPGARKKNR
ncbi:37S ribosomal protein S9, mitochondrial, partial [Clydaea vesicula]